MRTSSIPLCLCLALSGAAMAQGTPNNNDVFDQFFRYTDKENKVVFSNLPGETVDPFTGTLRISQVDFALPGHAGLDLQLVRTYSSKVWDRADIPAPTLLA